MSCTSPSNPYPGGAATVQTSTTTAKASAVVSKIKLDVTGEKSPHSVCGNGYRNIIWNRDPLSRDRGLGRDEKHAQRSRRCKMCHRWLCGGCPWMTALVDQNEQLWAHQKAEAVLVKDDMLMHILHEATCSQE